MLAPSQFDIRTMRRFSQVSYREPVSLTISHLAQWRELFLLCEVVKVLSSRSMTSYMGTVYVAQFLGNSKTKHGMHGASECLSMARLFVTRIPDNPYRSERS